MVQFSKIGFISIYDFPVVLPRYYGGVVLVGFGSFAMHMFLARRVIEARRQIDFPVRFFSLWLSTLIYSAQICITQQILNLTAFRELIKISESFDNF